MKNNWQRNWKLIILLIPFFFLFLNSCSDSSFSFTKDEYSEEFQEWLSTLPNNPEEFPDFWKQNEAEKWQYWKWTSAEYEASKNDSPEEIWRSKKINCHRGTVMLLKKYSGEYLLIGQGEGTPSHAVLRGRDITGVWYLSFSGLKCKFTRQYFEIWTEYRRKR